MPGLLDIGVLGDFRVLRDGVPIELPPSKKTRALLAYLAVTGQSHRRERLCELFWEIPDDPRGALRWSLSKIRQILGRSSERLETDRNAVALKVDGIHLDFARVGTLRRDDVGSRETSDLEEVAALYRGGFLSDLSLQRCPDFEAWRIAIATTTIDRVDRGSALGRSRERGRYRADRGEYWPPADPAPGDLSTRVPARLAPDGQPSAAKTRSARPSPRKRVSCIAFSERTRASRISFRSSRSGQGRPVVHGGGHSLLGPGGRLEGLRGIDSAREPPTKLLGCLPPCNLSSPHGPGSFRKVTCRPCRLRRSSA